jgi:hypothetical protein
LLAAGVPAGPGLCGIVAPARTVEYRRMWVRCGLERTAPRGVDGRSLSVVALRAAVGWRGRRGGAALAVAQPIYVIEQTGGAVRRRLVPDVTLGLVALASLAGWLAWSGPWGRQDHRRRRAGEE